MGPGIQNFDSPNSSPSFPRPRAQRTERDLPLGDAEKEGAKELKMDTGGQRQSLKSSPSSLWESECLEKKHLFANQPDTVSYVAVCPFSTFRS